MDFELPKPSKVPKESRSRPITLRNIAQVSAYMQSRAGGRLFFRLVTESKLVAPSSMTTDFFELKAWNTEVDFTHTVIALESA